MDYTYYLHENGWMVFKFLSYDDLNKVLVAGPYMSNGKPWVLKEMPPFFSFKDASFSSIPIWIKLPRLPLECWYDEGLSTIVSEVGEPIATDSFTKEKSHRAYARVLVEVDASKELTRKVSLTMPNGKPLEQEVCYEFEPRFCHKCKKIGHVEENCEAKEGNVIRANARRVPTRPRLPREEGRPNTQIVVDARTKMRADGKGKGDDRQVRSVDAALGEPSGGKWGDIEGIAKERMIPLGESIIR